VIIETSKTLKERNKMNDITTITYKGQEITKSGKGHYAKYFFNGTQYTNLDSAKRFGVNEFIEREAVKNASINEDHSASDKYAGMSALEILLS